MDVSFRDGGGYFGEECVVRELMVGIFVIERDDAFVGIKDVPVEKEILNWVNHSGMLARQAVRERLACHLSHCTPGFAISAVSVLGRDPPEIATVNLWRLSMASF